MTLKDIRKETFKKLKEAGVVKVTSDIRDYVHRYLDYIQKGIDGHEKEQVVRFYVLNGDVYSGTYNQITDVDTRAFLHSTITANTTWTVQIYTVSERI